MATAQDWPGQVIEAPSTDEQWPGDYAGDPQLSELRSNYADELKDPRIAEGLYGLTHNEVGRQGPEAARAFIETVFNRAAARGTTIAHTISDRNYYPRISFRPARANEHELATYDNILSDVLGGSNDSRYATGNASGGVGFAGGPHTYSAGGERFGIEGPDVGWHRKIPEISTKNIPQYGEEHWPGEIVEESKLDESAWPGQIVEKPEEIPTYEKQVVQPEAPQVSRQPTEEEAATAPRAVPEGPWYERAWDQLQAGKYNDALETLDTARQQGIRRALRLPITRPPTQADIEQAMAPGGGPGVFESLGLEQLPREEREAVDVAGTVKKTGYNLLVDTINFFNSPEGAAMAVTGEALPAAVNKFVALGFGAQSANSAIQSAMRGDWSDALENLGLTGLLGAGARHAAKAEHPLARPEPRVLPPEVPEAVKDEAAAAAETTGRPPVKVEPPIIEPVPARAVEAEPVTTREAAVQQLVADGMPEAQARAAVAEAPAAAAAVPPEAEQPAAPIEQPPAPVRAEEVPFFGPGAASIHEQLRPEGTTVEQATDLLREIRTGDSRSAYQKMTEAVGASKARGVDRLKKLKNGLSALWTGLKAKTLGEPEITDFDRWKGTWDANLQYADHPIKEFGKQLEKSVPNPERQAAINTWIDAGGDEALLQEAAKRAPEDTKQHYIDALNLSDDEQRIANILRSAYLEHEQAAIDAGLLPNEGVENYTKRVVTKRPEIHEDLTKRARSVTSIRTNFPEARQRYFQHFVEGERAGVRYDKRLRNASLYAQNLQRAIINRRAVDKLGAVQSKEGLPALVFDRDQLRKSAPVQKLATEIRSRNPGWSAERAMAAAIENTLAAYKDAPDTHEFRRWQWAPSDAGGGLISRRASAHPEFADKLTNAFARKDPSNVFVRGVLKAQGFAKASKLSLSLFHAVHEAVNAGGHLINPFRLQPLGEYLRNPVIRKGMEAGLKLVGDAHEQAYFSDLVGGGVKGLAHYVPGLGKHLTRMNEFMFENWIPRLKAEAYQKAYDRNLKGGLIPGLRKVLPRGRLLGKSITKLSPEQIAKITAEQINATFGEQNYRQMMRNPRLQTALRALFLAPDFGESKLRHIGQAGLTRYGGEQRMALGTVAGSMYLGARLLNQAINGDPRWDDPFGVKMGDRRYTIRSLPGDMAHMLTDTSGYIRHRLSPGVQNIVEGLYKRDVRGNVVDWGDYVKDMLLSFVPIPLTSRAGLSWKDQLTTAMGITPMRYQPENEVRKKIHDWKETSGDPRLKGQIERQSKESFLPSPYAGLRQALLDGNMNAARTEYRNLGTAPGNISQTMSKWVQAPITGSRITEARFLRTLSAKDRELYNQARAQRQLIYSRFRELQHRLLETDREYLRRSLQVAR